MTESPPSILVVEDERIVAMDLQQSLRDLGYDAFAIATSSDEALNAASLRCPDLVLMDIRIKGDRDGIETGVLLQSQFGVPVVYLTAHADESTLRRAISTQPHGYLLKPVRAAELRAAVELGLYKHEMDRRLRQRDRWYTSTLTSIADAVIAIDPTGNVTFMNPAAEVLTGAHSDSSIGRPILEVLRLSSREEGVFETPLVQALRDGRPVILEEGLLSNVADGTVRVINDSAAPVVDEIENQVLGAVMVFRDVTEKKKHQQQIELADRLTTLGTMAAGVAHEINNPLAVVLANSAFLIAEVERLVARDDVGPISVAKDESVAAIREALGDVQSAASRIARITSDLKVFSRPAVALPGNVDVTACMEWALRATAHEFRHRANVVTTFAPVPWVNADEARLGQVFTNLLVNAAQAIEPGHVDNNEVRIDIGLNEDGWVFARVQDTGNGIAPDVLSRVFDPFFTTKPVGIGTGLGLSICQGIVRSMRGEITVSSKVGHGSTFEVKLPPTQTEQQTPRQSKVEGRLFGRILIVDDEEMVLRIVKRILRGHDVTCMKSVEDALDAIGKGAEFDIIFSDMMMPSHTGVDFFERLLVSHPSLAKRIVFLSGGATTPRIASFLETVPNRKIEKPFDVSLVQDLVQEILATKR